MKQIRLNWSDDIARDDEQLTVDGVPLHPGGGLWRPDSPENRRTVEQMMAVDNETYGEGSYWIEERESFGS